jgi:hypothetical protein
VNVALHVGNVMVNDVVRVLLLKRDVGGKGIRMDLGSNLH